MQLGGYKNAIGFVLLCCALHPFRLTGVKISRKKAKVFNTLASDMTTPSTYWNKISPLWYANGTNDRHHPFLVHSLSHQTDRNVSFRARRSIEIAMHKHTHQSMQFTFLCNYKVASKFTRSTWFQWHCKMKWNAKRSLVSALFSFIWVSISCVKSL